MSVVWTAVAVVAALVALAWGCYWKMRFHRAKAEVYQEFADTFAGMTPMLRSPKESRRSESKRHYMRLALVDPLVRDGLADALEEAEAEWRNRSSLLGDQERDWKIVRVKT